MRTLRAAVAGLSRRGRMVLLGVTVLAITLGGLTYRSYDYIQHDPGFCLSCHIMEEPYEKWSLSPHHLVTCHRCHQQTLKASMEQVWFYVTRRPEKVVHHPELDHTVCAQCHLSQDPQWKLIGETAGHKVHFEKAGIDCLACHQGGVHEFLRPVDACVTCHADKMGGPREKMTFLHCTDCHRFLAKDAGLIPGRVTCLECHQVIHVGEETFPTEAPMSSFDCAVCHKPHDQIRPDRELCLTCHADVVPPHHRMKKGSSCTQCHRPHQWRVQ